MIKYPEGAGEIQKRAINMINEALEGIEITPDEEKSLIWLSNWELSTIENIIRAFKREKGARA